MTTTVRCETQCFNSLAEHELRCARRYRRFVSLVVATEESITSGLAELFEGFLRETDEVTDNGAFVTILMAETDGHGAWTAIRRLRERHGDLERARFAVASYPSDGRNVATLLQVAQGRLAMETL